MGLLNGTNTNDFESKLKGHFSCLKPF